MTTLTPRFTEALAWATELHRGHTRKATAIPYVSHLLAVTALVLEDGGDEDQAIAALLHDAVEDTDATVSEVERRFGPAVAGTVAACSDADAKPKPPWRARKQAFLDRLDDPTTTEAVLRVSAADKLHNARSILADYRRLGDALWDRFNPEANTPTAQLWYYDSLVDIYARRFPSQLTAALSETVRDLHAEIAAKAADPGSGTGRVVTLSASYGAGGSVIGPAVAARLEVPFLDRAIPVAVAEALAVPLADALAHDERRPPGIGRIIVKLASAAVPYGMSPIPMASEDEEAFRAQTEQVMKSMAETTGGVVLGRAGAVVLTGYPGALHVRLDGPSEARLTRAMAHEHLDEAAARKRLEDTDRAREAYVRHFYRVDPNDPGLYHLCIDSTALTLDACVQLIVAAAQSTPSAGPQVSG